MKKIATLGLCTCLSTLTGRAYAQASAFHDTPMDPVVIAGIEIVVLLGALYFLLPKKPTEEGTEKKNRYVGLIVFGFVLLAMMSTNPSLEDHRQVVLDELGKKISQNNSGDHASDGWEQFGIQLGESIGKIVLDRVVERENYLLFSITTVQAGDAKKDIGFGILGKVWLFHNWN
jgi:hypothetical protein